MQFEFYTKSDRLKYALRVPPAENRLTVYRRFEIRGQRESMKNVNNIDHLILNLQI